jgi:hypothetical protein
VNLLQKKYGSCVEFAPMPDTIKFFCGKSRGYILAGGTVPSPKITVAAAVYYAYNGNTGKRSGGRV